MTPEEKQRIREDLQEYVTGTLDEWLRHCIILQTEEDHDGKPACIRWEHPTDNALIATLSEFGYGDEFGRYGITVSVDVLEDLPPIGPENDPAMVHEVPQLTTTVESPVFEQVTFSNAEHRPPPEWVPATFLFCLAGDRIRIGTDESDVLRSSSGAWHANVVSSVLPSGKVWDKVTPWEHRELKLDLSANPGFREYPQDTPCEIWMSAERRAVHVLMSAFPGSTVLDSPQAEK